MCWISKKQDIKIAEQDIPIFKIMKKTSSPEIVKSIYQNFPYTLNLLTESNIEIKLWQRIGIAVDQALHSYNSEKVKCSSNSFILKIEVSNSSHDLIELDRFVENENIIKVKGIIPKGSKYMENIDGEFVSNQLILTEICAGLEN